MLFQIAATKSLSLDLNSDCCFPNLYPHLNYLNQENVFQPELNHCFEYLNIFNHFCYERNHPDRKSITNNLPLIQYPFYYQNINHGDHVNIDGFFQSEKYFKHNRDLVLDFLNFNSLEEYVRAKYSNILNNQITSIHVRRTDYVSNQNHHAVQSINYFQKAIQILEKETSHYIIFSDDINWCKLNFDMKNITFIENEKDYHEIYLMSLCNNHIISNSSFSWWGAWMNKNKNKTVIAPKKWFGPAKQESSIDIIPETWIKI
jgi:hypothetical protein